MAKTPEELFAYLDRPGIETETHAHEAVFTVAASEALHARIPGAHTKNLFVRDRKGRHFLVTVGAHAEVDLKRLHALIGAQGRVSFGKPEALMALLGVQPGAVTVFGALNDTDGAVQVVLDAALMAQPRINGHPLVNTATTTIANTDLLRFLEATGHPPAVLKVAA